jgi:hypothetical protein
VDPQAQKAPEPTIEDRIGAILAAEEAPADATPSETPKEAQTTSPPGAETTPPEESSEAVESDEPADDSTAVASDAAAEGDEAASEPSPEEEGITSLDDLAKSFEVTPEVLTSAIQITAPDGSSVPLAEVLSAFAKAPTAARDAEAAQAKVTEYEAKAAELQKEHDLKLGQLQQLTASLIAQIEQEPETDWAALEEDDPSEFLKRKIKAQERRDAVRGSIETMKQEAEKRDAEARKLRDEWAAAEWQKVEALMPAWKEKAKLDKDMEVIGGSSITDT